MGMGLLNGNSVQVGSKKRQRHCYS